MKLKNMLAYHLTQPINNKDVIEQAVNAATFTPLEERETHGKGFVPPLAYFENGEFKGDDRLFIEHDGLFILRVADVRRYAPLQVVEYELNKAVAEYCEREGVDAAPLEFTDAKRRELTYSLSKGQPPVAETFYGALDLHNQMFYAFDANEKYAAPLINLLKANTEHVRFISLLNQYLGDNFADGLTELMIGPFNRYLPNEPARPENYEHAFYLDANQLDDVILGNSAHLKDGSRNIRLSNDDLRSLENRMRLAASSKLAVKNIEICVYTGEHSSDPNHDNPRHMVCSALFDDKGVVRNLVASPTVKHSHYDSIETDHRDEVDLIIFSVCIRQFLQGVLPALRQTVNIHAEQPWTD